MTEQKGSYISTGVGGALTGRGANILLLDDVVKNSEDANSETMREENLAMVHFNCIYTFSS